MDFSNLKFCQPNEKSPRNMQPYRLLSTAMSCDSKTVDYPCVRLNGHKVAENVDQVKPLMFQANDFFKSRSLQGCHRIPVLFVSEPTKIQEAACQKLAAFSHNILDSLSKRHFPGLNITASYILDGFKPNPKPDSNSSQGSLSTSKSSSQPSNSKQSGSDSEQTKGTLISDHSADSFRLQSEPKTSKPSYANIAKSFSSTPRQSYAEVTKMAVGKTSCGGSKTLKNNSQNTHKRNSFFNRNNCDSYRRYSDNTNWRDRSQIKDLRRDKYEERKPRYVVEKHPNFTSRVEEPCECSNWRCRKHTQKSSPKQETIRRLKDSSFNSLSKRFGAMRLNNVCPPKCVVVDQVKVTPPSEPSLEPCEARNDSLETCSEAGTGTPRASECESEDSYIVFALDSDSSDSDSEESDEEDPLSEINARWRRQNPGPEPDLAPAKVTFSLPVSEHRMVCWSFAYRVARCGPWEQMARDRERFRQRVLRSAPLLAPVFDPANRRRALAGMGKYSSTISEDT